MTQLGHHSDIGTDYPAGTLLVVIGRGQTTITEIICAKNQEWDTAREYISAERVERIQRAEDGWAVVISADRIACSDLDSDRAVSAYAPIKL